MTTKPKRNSEFGIGSAPPRRSIFGNYQPNEIDSPGSNDTSVPLTPAISPREREKQATRGMSSDAPQAVPEQDECHPLPEGEGGGEGERVARRTETLQLSIDTALARSFTFRLLAKAFEDPELDGWQWLSSPPTKCALWSAMTTLCDRNAPIVQPLSPSDEESSQVLQTTSHEPTCSAGVPPASSPSVSLDDGPGGETPPELAAVDGCATPRRFNIPMPGMKTVEAAHEFANHLRLDGFESFHNDYVTCFGHTVRGDCPMNEIEYGDLKADPLFQPHRLADLGAFYAAFGLEMTPDAAERQDHISIELEFMSVLTAKETYALEHQFDAEQVAICREAQKKFLREHLGRWTPAFTRRLARMAGNTALGALSGFTGEFIAADCARFNITPGSEDLLLRPIDEASETLCASCGIANLPPGATSSPVES